jgi:hypothetical protein
MFKWLKWLKPKTWQTVAVWAAKNEECVPGMFLYDSKPYPDSDCHVKRFSFNGACGFIEDITKTIPALRDLRFEDGPVEITMIIKREGK